MRRRSSPREPALCIAAVAGILAVGALVVPWSRWREQTVSRAIRNDSAPAFWWPPAWRDELRTSILFEGNLRDGREGMLELVRGDGGPVLRAEVRRGRFSFHPRVLPAGPYRARFVAPDGRLSPWLPTGPLDPGSHRLNLAL
jgi:hypothetical protein